MVADTLVARAPRDTDQNAVAPTLAATTLAVDTLAGTAVAYGETLGVMTRGTAPAFFDVTDLVAGVVKRSGVWQGQLVAATAHTTLALILQENEPLLLADLADRLRRFAPESDLYRHNDMDIRTINVCGPEERENAHSHCQHALLGATVTLPICRGAPVLGCWQRFLLVELDHPRPRELTVMVSGVRPTTPAPEAR